MLAKIRGGDVAGFNKELNALIFGDVSQPGLLRNFEKELAESAQHVAEPVSSLATRIAAASNRKSLATAIATQKNHCDSEKHL